jgi:hypothetical protein
MKYQVSSAQEQWEKSIAALDDLKRLVDEYDQIKFESTEKSKTLSEAIAKKYGSVRNMYRRFTGNMEVPVENYGSLNLYWNYFEAGYLSGRTFHAHQGRQELLTVIGQAENSSPDQCLSPHDSVTSLENNTLNLPSIDNHRSMREKFENHPLIFSISLLIIGFVAGFGVSEWSMNFRDGTLAPVARSASAVSKQIESLTNEHIKRLKDLHAELREQEREAVYGGHINSTQQKHKEAAEHLRQVIEDDNSSYRGHLEQLINNRAPTTISAPALQS